jgi:hypothetical protein
MKDSILNEPSKFSEETEKEIDAMIQELAEEGISEQEFVNKLPHPAMFRFPGEIPTEKAAVKLMESVKDALIKRKRTE